MVYIQFHLRKGVSTTGDLAENLLEELNCKTAFTIPVFGGLPISESVVVTWLIMAILTILSICLVRNLKVTDVGRKQLVLEMGIGFLWDTRKTRQTICPLSDYGRPLRGRRQSHRAVRFQTAHKGSQCNSRTITYEHSFNRVFRFSRKRPEEMAEKFC